MFFSSKTKGYVLDQGEQYTTLSRLSSHNAPLEIEDVKEVPNGDDQALGKAIAEISAKKSGSYLFAKCAFNPEQGFVRRVTLDPKRVKEENYFTELSVSQIRVDPETNSIAVLNATDGLEFDAGKIAGTKDVLFCGMPTALAKDKQEELLGKGIYPESLELGSLLSLAALIDYLRFSGSTKPTLVLELGAQSTQSYIVSTKGVDAVRPISVGLEAMVPVVQKELGLKDEESARKLFFSNTFDFTGMGASLCKRLLKELQSSMGFYEVQTGQSISQLVCTVLPPKLEWLEAVIASQLGVSVLSPEIKPWLSSKGISLSPAVDHSKFNIRRFSTLGLVMNFGTTSSDVNAS